jgi:hypothetical protein
MHINFWLERMKRGDLPKDPGVDTRIIKWILWKKGCMWIGFIRLRIQTGDRFLSNSKEPSGFTKGGEFLDYQLLKDSAPCSYASS